MIRSRLFAASLLLVGVVLCAVDSGEARAQSEGMKGPPNVLVIQREFTKPGREGAAHQKTESAFMQALKAGNSKTRYFAMTSLSGPTRTLFFNPYDSLAAWEQDRMADNSNTTLAAELDRANQADGDLLSASEQSVWSFRPDLSSNTRGLNGIRYMTITSVRIRPGHNQEWEDLFKLVSEGYKKADPSRDLAVFQETYGSPGGGYLIIGTLKSAADGDAEQAAGKKFPEAIGSDGMKKLIDLESASVASVETNLFALSPSMSYPPDAWVKEDPGFWKLP